MTAPTDLSTFWLLYGRYGMTMTLENLRDEFFPGLLLKSVKNRQSAGLLPRRAGDVYDVRDVAEWWDEQRNDRRVSLHPGL